MKRFKIFGSKKAVNIFPVLMGAILMIALVLILVVALMNINSNAEEQATSARCRASVMAYSRLASAPQIPFQEGATTKETDIDCPVEYITIPDTNENDQRRMIADAMYRCWYNYGEGNIKLFSANDQKFCAICSLIQFEDKEDSLDGLPYWLMTQKVPLKREGHYPTYYEFICGNKPSTEALQKIRQEDIALLQGSKKYATLFTYMEESKWSASERFLTGAAIGFGVTVAGIILTPLTGGIGTAALGAMVVGTAGAAMDTGSGKIETNLVFLPYNTENIKKAGCKEIPVSMVQKRFR